MSIDTDPKKVEPIGNTPARPARVAHPPIVSREQWLVQRKTLLSQEKELTKNYDRVNAERRRLPMVKIEKDYVFDGPNGKQNLKALFDGRRQLIVYHFMFDPAWDKGCPGCTGWVDSLGDLSLLKKKDTTFVSSPAPRWPNLRPTKPRRAGASRGFLRLAAISITTFT